MNLRTDFRRPRVFLAGVSLLSAMTSRAHFGNRLVRLATVFVAAVAFVSLLVTSNNVSAESEGGLDLSFNSDGWNSYGEDGMWFDTDDVVIQSDGKIVVGGSRLNGMRYDPMMLRFHSNGLLDTSFGVDGVVVAEWPNSEGIVGKVNEDGAGVGLDVLADDRLALVSSPLGTDGSEKHGVMLFTADGALDTSFSGDGRVTVENWGETMDIYTLDVLVDENTNRILVLGVAPNNSWEYKANLLRFNTDGTLDSTFGWHGNGKGGYKWPNTVDNIPHTLAMRDHKIFVGGSSSTDWTHHLMSIMQLTKDGTGYDWRTTVDFGFGDSKAKAMAVQNANEVVAAGWTYVSGNYTIPAVTRIDSAGNVDTTFGGGDGKFTYDFGASVDSTANSVLIDRENRIVIGGNYDIYGSSRPFIIRLTSDGELDTTFGNGGVMLYDEMIAGNAEWFMSATRYDYRDVITAGGTGTNVLVTRLSALYSSMPTPTATCNGISIQGATGRTVTVDVRYWETLEIRNFEFQIDSDNFSADFRDHPSWWTEADVDGHGVHLETLSVDGEPLDPDLGGLECHKHFSLHYDLNGGDGSLPNHDVHTDHFDRTEDTIRVAEAPTRQAYIFSGWNTEADGSGTSYAAGAEYEVPEESGTTATLYAQWTAVTLSITYDSQGGSTVSDGDTTTTAGGSIATLPANPTRDGYTFSGWYTAASGGTQITAGVAHGQTTDFTLYAQWTADPTTTTTTTTTTTAPPAAPPPTTTTTLPPATLPPTTTTTTTTTTVPTEPPAQDTSTLPASDAAGPSTTVPASPLEPDQTPPPSGDSGPEFMLLSPEGALPETGRDRSAIWWAMTLAAFGGFISLAARRYKAPS